MNAPTGYQQEAFVTTNHAALVVDTIAFVGTAQGKLLTQSRNDNAILAGSRGKSLVKGYLLILPSITFGIRIELNQPFFLIPIIHSDSCISRWHDGMIGSLVSRSDDESTLGGEGWSEQLWLLEDVILFIFVLSWLDDLRLFWRVNENPRSFPSFTFQSTLRWKPKFPPFLVNRRLTPTRIKTDGLPVLVHSLPCWQSKSHALEKRFILARSTRRRVLHVLPCTLGRLPLFHGISRLVQLWVKCRVYYCMVFVRVLVGLRGKY